MIVAVGGMHEVGRRWSIGELARATGLTVRMLYHYDEIGLVRAIERTGSVHRRYSEADLRRLFMATLETISLLDAYRTREQRDSLIRRRAELGEDTIEALRLQWLGLVRELRRHQVDGTPPEDPRVQALAVQWDEIGGAFRSAMNRPMIRSGLRPTACGRTTAP